MVNILVTNDDGVNALGILALTQAMKSLGSVTVVAPAVNQSASGHKKTLFTDIPFHWTHLADGTPALAVHGSPADCVGLAMLGVGNVPKPDFVVSGINHGENMSQDITYSGTVTASLEGAIHAVPSVAVSLANREVQALSDLSGAQSVAIQVVRQVMKHPLPLLTVLNVNVPKGNVKGIKITRQGVRIFRDELLLKEGIAQIVGEPPTGILDERGTDLWAIHEGYASVTPIHLDMTAHRFMADLSAWGW